MDLIFRIFVVLGFGLRLIACFTATPVWLPTAAWLSWFIAAILWAVALHT
jgi:hypothetical protein